LVFAEGAEGSEGERSDMEGQIEKSLRDPATDFIVYSRRFPEFR
jgi:hypothetical protein